MGYGVVVTPMRNCFVILGNIEMAVRRRFRFWQAHDQDDLIQEVAARLWKLADEQQVDRTIFYRVLSTEAARLRRSWRRWSGQLKGGLVEETAIEDLRDDERVR